MKRRKLRPVIELILWIIVFFTFVGMAGFVENAPLLALGCGAIAYECGIIINKWGGNFDEKDIY